MTQRRRRLLVALAVLALLGVLALPAVHWRLYGWWRGEPFFQGRPTSYWSAVLREARFNGSTDGPFDPTHVSFPIGPIPELLDRLGIVGRGLESWDPDELVWATDNALAVPFLVQLLDDPSANVRGWSAWALGRAGTSARTAIPALRRLTEDQGFMTIKCSVGMVAAQALEKIDPNTFKDPDRP
jgi:hypothetical protein